MSPRLGRAPPDAFDEGLDAGWLPYPVLFGQLILQLFGYRHPGRPVRSLRCSSPAKMTNLLYTELLGSYCLDLLLLQPYLDAAKSTTARWELALVRRDAAYRRRPVECAESLYSVRLVGSVPLATCPAEDFLALLLLCAWATWCLLVQISFEARSILRPLRWKVRRQGQLRLVKIWQPSWREVRVAIARPLTMRAEVFVPHVYPDPRKFPVHVRASIMQSKRSPTIGSIDQLVKDLRRNLRGRERRLLDRSADALSRLRLPEV